MSLRGRSNLETPIEQFIDNLQYLFAIQQFLLPFQLCYFYRKSCTGFKFLSFYQGMFHRIDICLSAVSPADFSGKKDF